jgi:hypothetical protein
MLIEFETLITSVINFVGSQLFETKRSSLWESLIFFWEHNKWISSTLNISLSCPTLQLILP